MTKKQISIKLISALILGILIGLLFVFIIFKETTKTQIFSVNFYNENGEFITNVKVKEGDSVNYANELPTKEGDSLIYYVFDYWGYSNGFNATKLLECVRGNINVYPVFKQKYHEYEVNFYDEDKTTLIETQIAVLGRCSSTETHQDRSDGEYYYNFEGWAEIETNAIIDVYSDIKENKNLYPVFKKIKIMEYLDGIYYRYLSGYNVYEVIDADISITSAHIPSYINDVSVGRIQHLAFGNCSYMTSLIIPKTVTYIGGSLFRFSNRFQPVTSIVVEEGNKTFDSRGNCNAIIRTITNELILGCHTTIIPNDVLTIGSCAFSGNDLIGNMEIPNSVVCIDSSAFAGCSSLESISLPNVTSIESDAFSDCVSLTSVEMPKVQIIKSSAFYGCSLLQNVQIPNVTTIAASTFRDCSSLESISLQNVTSIGEASFSGCVSLTSVEMPKVMSIDNYAFAGCSFASVVLPVDLEYIGNDIFMGCYDLENVYYKGNVSNWENITKQDGCINLEILYFYIENEQDVPKDGGKYWHYDEDGITPVVWISNE